MRTTNVETGGRGKRLPRWAVRSFGGVVGLAVLFTGVMGFAHTKPGRPLLTWMGMAAPKAAAGACPFGYGPSGQSVEQKDAQSRAFAANHAGTELAAALPALGFELGRTTHADIDAWAQAFGVSCKRPRTGGDLDCSNVPAAALPEGLRSGVVSSLWLTFGAEDKLTQARVMRRATTPEDASGAFKGVLDDVEKRAGTAITPKRTGDGSAASLQQGLLAQSSAELRFKNYYVVLRATNMGDTYTVTEEYRLLPTG